jgi:outer membrane protein
MTYPPAQTENMKTVVIACFLTLLPCVRVHAQERPAVRLSLQRAVEIALSPEGSARYQLAHEYVKQSETRSAQVRAALLPDLDGQVAYQSQTRNLDALGLRFGANLPGLNIPSFAGPYSFFDVRSNVRQSVFDLGAIRRYQSSRAAIGAAKADRDDTGDQVAAQVTRMYLAVLKADADVSAAKANIDLAEALVDLVEDQKKAGTGMGIETIRARVQLANERQRLLVVTNQRRAAELQLLRAMGQRLDMRLELDGDLAYIPTSTITWEQALQEALQSRADYKAQQEREHTTRLSASATTMERLPSVSAFADYGSVGTAVNNALPTRTYGLSVRIPVFDGGRRNARRAESFSQYRQEQIRTSDLREQIELEIRLALDSLTSAQEQVQVAEEGLRLAEDELASARRRYLAGVATSVEVTDAQTRLERARDNRVTALFEHNLARLDLAQAQGTVQQIIQ